MHFWRKSLKINWGESVLLRNFSDANIEGTVAALLLISSGVATVENRKTC
jgi:hypothetical protein